MIGMATKEDRDSQHRHIGNLKCACDAPTVRKLDFAKGSRETLMGFPKDPPLSPWRLVRNK